MQYFTNYGALMRFIVAHPLPLRVEPLTKADETPEKSIDIETLLPGYQKVQSADHQRDFLLVPERGSALGPAGRLVVMVPNGNIDENEFAHRIWKLASIASLPIHFLAFSVDRDSSAYWHSRLATIAAVTSFGQVKTSTGIIAGNGWLRSLRRMLRPGDLLVCLNEHQVPYRIFGQRVLGEYLSTSLDVPVYLMNDLDVDASSFWLSRLKGAFSWFASFAIILVFALIQIWIDQTTADPTSTILLCLSVIIEFLLILKTNEWFG
jgi:hypothetical protein